MKKIIVPTDFSETARNAYRYACDLAEYLECEIGVINVCHPNTDSINGFQIPSFQNLIQSHRAKLNDFVLADRVDTTDEVLKESLVEQQIVLGFAGDELLRISKEADTDLLLMGTSGNGGVFEQLFGSVSTKVSKSAGCPVWLVPPNVGFKGLQNILYACDYESASEKMTRQVIGLAGRFDANIHMVHVYEDKKTTDIELDEILIEQLFRKKAPALEFRMSKMKSSSIWEGLSKYAKQHEIDLIVLVTQHRTFWENLLHKSTTSAMILHADTPLLVYHIDNEKK